MPTLYVENVPEDLYNALRERARKHRKSMAAEVLSLIEQNVPTAAELKRRQLAFQQILRIRKALKPGAFPSTEQMQREDRDR
jgi:plasmid stability protein